MHRGLARPESQTYPARGSPRGMIRLKRSNPQFSSELESPSFARPIVLNPVQTPLIPVQAASPALRQLDRSVAEQQPRRRHRFCVPERIPVVGLSRNAGQSQHRGYRPGQPLGLGRLDRQRQSDVRQSLPQLSRQQHRLGWPNCRRTQQPGGQPARQAEIKRPHLAALLINIPGRRGA